MMSDSMFIVGAGRVMLSAKNASGQDTALGEISAGDWLGELALISTGQRQCTATAGTDVSAFEMRQADFQRMMATKPQACIKLMMTICTHLGQKMVANKEALKALVSRV